MEGILELIFKNREEKVNNSHFNTLESLDIVNAYEKYKHETKFWKSIRKSVYRYAIGTLTHDDCVLIETNTLSTDNIRLSDDTEDKILVMLLVDFFNNSIKHFGPRYGNKYIKDILANIARSYESGNPKMAIASAIRSFTIYGVYLVDALVTDPIMPIIDKICGFTLEEEIEWKK